MEVYLRQIDEAPLLTAEQEKALCWRIISENCPAARDRMIRSNLRLVVCIAKKFADRGMALPDLIEEGNLGLLRAVEAFDPEQGARFSTYAAWWIKQSIKRALVNAAQPVHVPAYMVELVSRWKKHYAEECERLGRTPSLHEMAEAMDLPLRKVRIVREALRATQRPTQAGGGDGESPGFEQTLADSRTPEPGAAAEQADELQALEQMLELISDREATILRLRYGLEGEEPLTLKQIGKRIGITRERVRQIEQQALQRLHERMRPEHRGSRSRNGAAEPVAESPAKRKSPPRRVAAGG
jgi:RNA polymerase primary sigma factor